MTNLIPPEGKKVVRQEYLFRVGATYGFLFSAVLILLSAALIPTYVLVGAQIEVFEIEKEQSNSDTKALQEIDDEIGAVKEILAQLKRVPDNVLPSILISEIKNTAPNSIKFNNFSVQIENNVIETILIQGEAPTRETLAELKDSIEASEFFDKAEVPIADLARDADLPFSITVTLTQN